MSKTKMTKPSLAVIAVLILTGCASGPSNTEPRGDVARLNNRVEYQGQARLDYVLEFADEKEIGPGFWTVTMPANIVSEIEPGRTVIGLKILYTPAYGKNIFARGNDRQYFIFVRDLGFSEERIEYMSQSIPDVEAVSLSGLRGLRFDAIAGQTYQPACRIENGEAYVWMEDLDGNIVSDTVRGIADAQYTVHTVTEMGMHSHLHGHPNLTGGWKVLDDLPDPIR